MEIFFDTTVLVAASEQGHPHYTRAWPALRRIATGEDKGFISVHSIAEVYASLTRLPVRPRIHPLEAVRIVTDNILAHFEVVPIGKEDYMEALNTVGSGGWTARRFTTRCCCAAPRDARWSVFTRSTSETSSSWHRLLCKG